MRPQPNPKGWWQDRLNLKAFSEKFLHKAFPAHPTFLFGEMALFSFVLLVITGLILGMGYEPSVRLVDLFGEKVPAAYASVVRGDLALFGQIVRNAHHWSAQLMIAALLAHVLRVFFTGSYRNPREINWWVGLVLMLVTFMAAFTGYLLPYSEFSVTATSIGFFMSKSVPWIGDLTARLFFGGEFPSAQTIPRFFFYHVMLIPLVIAGLIGLHMVILVQQKHTERPGNQKLPEAEGGKKLIGIPLWPHQVLFSLTFFFILTGLVILVSTYIPINPVAVFGPPQPGATPKMRPEWYFLVIYGMLKLIPGTLGFTVWGGHISQETVGGVFFPTLIVILLLIVPWLDRSPHPVHYMANPLHRPWPTGLGLMGMTFFGLLGVAGYIDILGVNPGTMAWIVIWGTLGSGILFVGLLKRIAPRH
jgi:cytochrome b-561